MKVKSLEMIQRGDGVEGKDMNQYVPIYIGLSGSLIKCEWTARTCNVFNPTFGSVGRCTRLKEKNKAAGLTIDPQRINIYSM